MENLKDPEKSSWRLLYEKIRDYYFPPRKELEPTCYRRTRMAILFIIYCLIMGFIAFIIVGFYKDEPFIQEFRRPDQAIPLTAVIFDAPFPFTVECFHLDNNAEYGIPVTSCSADSLVRQDHVNVPGSQWTYLDEKANFSNSIQGLYFKISNVKVDVNLNVNGAVARANYMKISLFDRDLFAELDKIDETARGGIVDSIRHENVYLISPQQKHIVWFERIQYADLNVYMKNSGVMGIFENAIKNMNKYYGLSAKIDKASSLMTDYATIEIYNQSSTLIFNKQTNKASSTTVIAFFTSLGGATGFLTVIHNFLFDGKEGPGLLAFFLYAFCCRRSRPKEPEKSPCRCSEKLEENK